MLQKFYILVLVTLVVSSQFHATLTAPLPQNDIDDYGGGLGSMMTMNNPNGVDYNSVMGHFKDFVMYLPVMMTTLKETMTGFPKFAKGIRILTSQTGHLEDEDDCKCREGSSNEIDNSSRYN